MVEPSTAAWACALGGIGLGALVALVPGLPGGAVALLGLVAFAAMSDFVVVPESALVVAALVALAGWAGQILAPVSASRAVGGSAGAATGAAVGAALGSVVPLPFVAWGGAVIGALTLGLIGSRRKLLGWLRGVMGTTSGCGLSIAADLLAVLGVAAVLAVCDAQHAYRSAVLLLE